MAEKTILMVDEHYHNFSRQRTGIEQRFGFRIKSTDGTFEARCWLEDTPSYKLGIIDPRGQLPRAVKALFDDCREQNIPVILLSGMKEEDLQADLGIVKGEDYAHYRHRLVNKLSLYALIDELLQT